MAKGRPNQIGLEFFSINVNMFSDIKVRKLIKYQGGNSMSVYIYLLCVIYENGYFVEYSELLKNKLARLVGLSAGLIDEVIGKLVKYEFFNELIFCEHNILTSEAIQKRWVKISQYIPNSFITSNINLIKEIKIPKYKLLDEKPRLYQYNVKLWYRTIKEVFKRDNYTCQYCGQIGGKLEADHIIPFSKGGMDEMSNLITSCRKCNRQKKDKSVDEFIKWRELN